MADGKVKEQLDLEISDESASGRLIKCIDEVEKRVEILREQAIGLQKEKESLLSLLQDLQDNSSVEGFPQDEREEIEFNTERLICRCLTVEVSVSTPRNEPQEEAFKKVKALLEKLSTTIEESPEQATQLTQSYLNACLPEPVGNHIDMRFQGVLLECTVDDQKRVRKKLEDLLYSLQHSQNTSINENGHR